MQAIPTPVRVCCALLLLMVLALALPAAAQEPPPEPPALEEYVPVPVPEPDELTVSYYRSGNMLWFIRQSWGIVIPLIFLFTGFSARLRGWSQWLVRPVWPPIRAVLERLSRISPRIPSPGPEPGRSAFVVIGMYFTLFLLINFLLELPLSYLGGFERQHSYGLSNQTFAKWMTDSLLLLGISLFLGWLLLWIPYLLLRKSPRRWWLYCGLLLYPFLFLAIFLAPLLFDPLFNEFGPMQDKALEARILNLAERAGIEGSQVWEVEKSVDTNAMNAYVTGFMNTKRIVLWDTIIEKMEEDELLFVMAHEMGHFVLGHVVRGILFYGTVALISFYFVYRLAHALLARFRHRFGFGDLHDIASLPLLILCINITSLIFTPIALAHSRYHEHEADRFALEITRDNRAAAHAFLKLQQENLGMPRTGALHRWWRGSHPSIGDRIDFFNSYFPWNTGEPLRYGHYFRPEQTPTPERAFEEPDETSGEI